MHKLIELIEKGKPFFEKISRNIYLRAIRDGFIAGMPVILSHLSLSLLPMSQMLGDSTGQKTLKPS